MPETIAKLLNRDPQVVRNYLKLEKP